MKTYLVGGSIRDKLMGRKPKDKDYVIVGSTPQEMIDLGYKQVGADFPVFLDEFGDEYALARQERKVGPGYHGFETHYEPDVTLEDDLWRRDLTINAMAEDEAGNLIDPFNGQEDLNNGILRHVSDAFSDDPVRVLRIARFAARYGFEVASETKWLLGKLAHSGELDHLTPERVWSEFSKALMENDPAHFIQVLEECGALDVLFPEIGRSLLEVGVPLRKAVLLHFTLEQRIMILLSEMSVAEGQSLLARYRAPARIMLTTARFNFLLNALKANTNKTGSFGIWDMDHERLMDLFQNIDMFRQPDDAPIYGSTLSVFDERTTTRMYITLAAFQIASEVNFASLTFEQQQTLEGSEIKKAINELKVKRISSLNLFS